MGILQLKAIKKLLESNGMKYDILEHAPVYTSEQAAKARGVDLMSGVKALVLKTDKGSFVMALVSGDKKVDLKRLAKILGKKKLNLARPSEVLKTTGCTVGSVHPFGNITGLQTYMDRQILKNKKVEFSAGLHTISMAMDTQDLLSVIKPEIADFSL